MESDSWSSRLLPPYARRYQSRSGSFIRNAPGACVCFPVEIARNLFSCAIDG